MFWNIFHLLFFLKGKAKNETIILQLKCVKTAISFGYGAQDKIGSLILAITPYFLLFHFFAYILYVRFCLLKCREYGLLAEISTFILKKKFFCGKITVTAFMTMGIMGK